MKRITKWLAVGVGTLVALLGVGLGGVYGFSEYGMRKTYAVAEGDVAIPTDAAAVERGRHIAFTRACSDCHGPGLGGNTFIDDPALGRIFASNLTRGRGGVGARNSDADWVRAIRNGVGHDGRSLLVMPSYEYHGLSDEDVGALVAYLKTLPPVDREPVESRVGPVGRALYLAGQLPLLPAEMVPHDAPRAPAPPAGPTAAYGAYLAPGCTGCHGPGFSGGPIPGGPPGMLPPTNITPDVATGIGSWTEEDFFRALREGKRPDGSALDPSMPWKNIGAMTDDEIRALWAYLRTVPAKPEGQR